MTHNSSHLRDRDQVLINTAKTAIGWSGFKQRHNHAGHVIGVAELTDMQGVTIPGLTLQIEVKAAADVQRCLYLFSIMQTVKTKRTPAYQLEVAPADKRTHNGVTTIYGPHEHVGRDDEPTAVVNSDVTCDNWDGALLWFFNRVSIVPFPIENPNGTTQL